jgi:hypothetical protein
MTNEEVRTIAETAYDGLAAASGEPLWITLDAQAQSMLFDSASAIVYHGGPTTEFELAVAEAAAAAAEAPPEGGALSVEERQAAAKEANERRAKAKEEAEEKLGRPETLEERQKREAEQEREWALAHPKEPAKGGKPQQLPAAEEKLRKDREAEKDRIAAWKGAVTEEEKKRREREEDRLDKEEDRIKKAKLAQKNGPDKK